MATGERMSHYSFYSFAPRPLHVLRVPITFNQCSHCQFLYHDTFFLNRFFEQIQFVPSSFILWRQSFSKVKILGISLPPNLIPVVAQGKVHYDWVRSILPAWTQSICNVNNIFQLVPIFRSHFLQNVDDDLSCILPFSSFKPCSFSDHRWLYFCTSAIFYLRFFVFNFNLLHHFFQSNHFGFLITYINSRLLSRLTLDVSEDFASKVDKET